MEEKPLSYSEFQRRLFPDDSVDYGEDILSILKVDITDKSHGNVSFNSLRKKPAFERYQILEDDLLELRKKWLGTDEEVLVQHMIDSVIIFAHNIGNMKNHKIKLRRLDHLKNLQPYDEYTERFPTLK